jgi:hypothetical protein
MGVVPSVPAAAARFHDIVFSRLPGMDIWFAEWRGGVSG